jgi:Papain-like cysteine protease AvrRpt2
VPDTMKQLTFSMQRQQRNNWCWAAVATSVSHFRDAASPWTQCELATQELSRGDCCAAGACDTDWFLDRALTRTGNLRSFSTGAESMPAIQGEVDGDLPLGVRVQWQGGGGHFVVVTGYDEVNNLVTISDPLEDAPVTLDYDSFVSRYEGIGSWSHSYFTQ